MVELVADTTTLLLPTSTVEITRALLGLRVGRLLEGFRGGAKVDIHKIAAQIYQMCIAYLENCHTIVEIEINPLFVYSEKICAVDALVHMAAEG